jgi:hypothetical protein
MNRGLLIKELPYNERPRERLAAEGPDKLKNSEFIAILLRTGTRGASALEIGRELMACDGGTGTALSLMIGNWPGRYINVLNKRPLNNNLHGTGP